LQHIFGTLNKITKGEIKMEENKLKNTNKRIDDIEADLRTLIDKMERLEQSITNLNHKIKQSEVK